MAKFVLKGVSFDRSTRSFVCAANLEELKDEFRRKFKLPEGNYEVYRESDGTKIDDSEIFQLLALEAQQSRDQLGVMLLGENQSWTDPNCQVSLRSHLLELNNDDSDRTASTSSDSDSQITPVSRPRQIAFPMSDVSDYLDEILEMMESETPPKNLLALKKRAVKEVCHAAGRYILKKLRDYRKGTARNLAKYIIDYDNSRYKKIFQIVVGTTISDPGYNAFGQSIYAFVNHNKGPEHKSPRGSRSSRTEEEEDDFGLLPPHPSKQDLYGCVAYEVPLPFGETAATQEVKRLDAISLSPLNPLGQEADTLMAATYATQRVDINRSKPLKTHLPGLLENWPLLAQKSHFLSHAKTLLGKDVQAVFTNNVSQQWKTVFDFFKLSCIAESSKETVPAKITEMQSIIKAAEDMSVRNQSIEARCRAMFPLITLHMGEKLEKFYVVLPVTASDKDVIEAGANLNGFPLLVIRGESIFDCNECTVVLVGKVCIHVGDPLEGILVLLLSYFVFTCVYQPANHSSLEFYQRFFLDINPDNGDKRAVKRKTVDGVDRKVKKLAELLAQHACHWTL